MILGSVFSVMSTHGTSVSSTMSGLTQTLPGHPPLFQLPPQHRLYIINGRDEAEELEGRHRTSSAPPFTADNCPTWLFCPHQLLYNQSQHASNITDRSPSSVIPPQPWQPCRLPTPAPPPWLFFLLAQPNELWLWETWCARNEEHVMREMNWCVNTKTHTHTHTTLTHTSLLYVHRVSVRGL